MIGLSGSDTICSGLLAKFIDTGVGKFGFVCDRLDDGVVATDRDFFIVVWELVFGFGEFAFLIGMRSCV